MQLISGDQLLDIFSEKERAARRRIIREEHPDWPFCHDGAGMYWAEEEAHWKELNRLLALEPHARSLTEVESHDIRPDQVLPAVTVHHPLMHRRKHHDSSWPNKPSCMSMSDFSCNRPQVEESFEGSVLKPAHRSDKCYAGQGTQRRRIVMPC